jgi:hypothetical protein
MTLLDTTRLLASLGAFALLAASAPAQRTYCATLGGKLHDLDLMTQTVTPITGTGVNLLFGIANLGSPTSPEVPISPTDSLPGPRWTYSRQQPGGAPHPNDSALPQNKAFSGLSIDCGVRNTVFRSPILRTADGSHRQGSVGRT